MEFFKGVTNKTRTIDCKFCELEKYCEKSVATGCNSLSKILKINKETIKDANFFIYMPTDNL